MTEVEVSLSRKIDAVIKEQNEQKVVQAAVSEQLKNIFNMVKELKNDVKEQFAKFDARFATNERVDELERKIDKQGDWQTWVIRVILGIVLTAVIGGVLYIKQ